VHNDFLFNFNRNYVSILNRLQVIQSYSFKVAYIDLLHLQLLPPLGVTPFEFTRDLWHQEPRVSGLSCLRDARFSHLIQYRRVTDRKTHDDSIYCTRMASRGKKNWI